MRIHVRVASLAVLLGVAAFMTPAPARSATTARIMSCGAANCLVVHGRRVSADAAVRINGHPVRVAGGTRWSATMPIETVREWSSPFARTLEVAVSGRTETVRLPIGMLGGRIELASLIVRAR